MKINLSNLKNIGQEGEIASNLYFPDGGAISHIKGAKGTIVLLATIKKGTITSTGFEITEDTDSAVLLAIDREKIKTLPPEQAYITDGDPPIGLPCPPYCN